MFKKTIDSIIPILMEKQSIPSVILLPLPRYIFFSCCNDPSHSTNANEENFAQNMVMQFIQLRTTLIRHQVARGLKNFRVLDTCCTTRCISMANTSTRTSALRQVTAKDGVHFVTSGYKHLTLAYVGALRIMLATCKLRQNRSVTSGEVSGAE
jgi:hypothetical protein